MLVQEQGLVFFSASGTPQMYKTRLLCSLLPLHGPSCWQMEDERRGQKGFFVVWSVLFFFFFLCTAGKISLGNSRASLHFCNHCQVSDRARKPQWDFWRMQKPDAAGKHHVFSKERSNITGKKKKGQAGSRALLPSF